MSLDSLLVHKCDIFHITTTSQGTSFGVPQKAKYGYPTEADLKDVPCYVKEINQTISQGQPNNSIIQVIRITFSINTDIRLNDKILYNGSNYILQVPTNIRDSHWIVTALKEDNL